MGCGQIQVFEVVVPHVGSAAGSEATLVAGLHGS